MSPQVSSSIIVVLQRQVFDSVGCSAEFVVLQYVCLRAGSVAAGAKLARAAAAVEEHEQNTAAVRRELADVQVQCMAVGGSS